MSDYIQSMRKWIGHETLFTVGCGAIIEDGLGRILLQHRKDNDCWGIPGGVMELGETFAETVKREVFEETRLTIKEFELFGIYSGKTGFAQYANGDKVYSVQIIFRVTKYDGILSPLSEESQEHRFFHKEEIPGNLNRHQAPFILDWVNGIKYPIVK